MHTHKEIDNSLFNLMYVCVFIVIFSNRQLNTKYGTDYSIPENNLDHNCVHHLVLGC